MTLIAAALIALTLIGLYVHHTKVTAARVAADRKERDQGIVELQAALVLIQMAITDIEIPPVDLSGLAMTEQTVQLLHDHMGTISRDMAVLTTRVETGPGKRTIAFP